MNFEMVMIKYDDLSAAFDFVSCAAPWEHQAFVSLDTAVRAIFQHRGAYARFKDLSTAEGQLAHWYAFEAGSTQQALRRWCEENQILLVEPTVTLE